MAIDIALAFATQTEWEAFKKAVQLQKNWTKLPAESYITTFNSPAYYLSTKGYRIAAIKANNMGQVHAACTAKNIIHQLQPRFIFSIGVAAGLPGKASILDFLIPKRVRDLSLSKMTEQGQQHDGDPGLCDGVLVGHMNTFFSDISKYYKKSVLKNKELKKINLAHDKAWKGPKSREGVVLCDNAVRNDGFFSRQEINNESRKVIGGEMESFGFTSAIHCLVADNIVSRVPRFAMLKGVVDFGLGKTSVWQKDVAPAVAKAIIAFIDHDHEDFDFIAKVPDQDRFKNAVKLALTNLKTFNTPAKKALASALITATLEELDTANSDLYKVAIDVETNYLLRAKPIFQGADSLIATSIDSVSRFWTRDHTNSFAKEYLKAQVKDITSREIKRLFVFHTAEEAHLYANILDAHERAYGQVFICSINTYQEISKKFMDLDSPHELLNMDFALLGYPHEGKTARKHNLRILGKKYFTSIDINKQELLKEFGMRYFKVDQLETVFDNFGMIDKGKADKGLVEESTGYVLSWTQQKWKHNDWSENLQLLFPQLDRDVIHMEFVAVPHKIKVKDLKQAFSAVKTAFLKKTDKEVSVAEKYNVTDVWSGKRIRNMPPTSDFNAQNALDLSPLNAAEFVIYLKFRSQKDLECFYQDEEHVRIRNNFYKALSPHIDILIENNRNHSSDHFKLSTAAIIESFASIYISKFDFTEADEIDDIVQRTPYPWD